MKPQEHFPEGSWHWVAEPMIARSGFREYDARWRYPEQINLRGAEEFGCGLGMLMNESGIEPQIVVGCDFRDYSPGFKSALVLGLIRAGIDVVDIGVVITPVAYFARWHLNAPAMAMVTASHNPNGWTGVKSGFGHPFTLDSQKMGRLREIVIGGCDAQRRGGGYSRKAGIEDAYLDRICAGPKLTGRIRAVCATGNGTASIIAKKALERIGVEVIERHCTPNAQFPNYNPNPESLEMLSDMAATVTENEADVGLGFDGDGDRVGVVDNLGREIFADKMGVLLAREIAASTPSPLFIADVKSTGIFATDPVLAERGSQVAYWKTGHSYMKEKVAEAGAAAGFEKSGHFYFAPPEGFGFDCGLQAAIRILRMLDNHRGLQLSDLADSLPRTWITPTMSPYCSDNSKYAVIERIQAQIADRQAKGKPIGGQQIRDINTINGIRATLANGSWALVRASSNTPNLVVVCESVQSEEEMKAIFSDIDQIIRCHGEVGAYDQTI